METPGIEFIEPQKFGDCPLISTGPKSTEHTELVITVTFSSPVNGDGSTAYQVERLAFNLNGNIAACDREALSRSIQKSYEELAATTSVTSRVGERIRGGSSSVLVQFGQTSTLSAGAPSDQRQPGRTTSSSAKVSRTWANHRFLIPLMKMVNFHILELFRSIAQRKQRRRAPTWHPNSPQSNRNILTFHFPGRQQ